MADDNPLFSNYVTDLPQMRSKCQAKALNLCSGGRRNKLLGNCRYRSMSFLCPSKRLFAAKDTDRKADRDPNELLHLADYYHELTRRQSGSKRILRIALRFCE